MAKAIKNVTFEEEIPQSILIDAVVDSLSDNDNWSVHKEGPTTIKVDENSAPMVGMGANSWRRGRAYSVIVQTGPKSFEITTEILAWTVGLWNSKYCEEVAGSLETAVQKGIRNALKEQRQSAPAQAPASAPDPTKQLLQAKQLLDAGAISQEEYDAIKAKVLQNL